MKRHSSAELETMHEVAPLVARWRRALGWLLPRSWLHPALVPPAGIRGRRLSSARMELEPAVPAKSWADWEFSRRGRSSG
jgi:hypothetical protein